MPATPTYQLPYPAQTEPADVPLDMQELAERIEAVVGPGTANGQVPVWDHANKKWVATTPAAPATPTLSMRAHSAAGGLAWAAADNNFRIYVPALTVDWDNIGLFTGAANVVTIPVGGAGRYQLIWTIHNLSAAGNLGMAEIQNDVNVGKTVSGNIPLGVGGQKGGLTVTELWNAAAGAAFKTFAFSTGGGTAQLVVEVVKLA